MSASSGADVHWFLAGLMAAAVIGILIYLPVEWVFDTSAPNFSPLPFIPIGLGLIGLYQLAQALRLTARARKFGASTLALTGAGTPRMGGRLEGVVHTSTRLQPTGDVQVTLQCVDVHEFRAPESSTSNTRTREYVTWEHTLAVPADGLDSQHGIVFAFDVPDTVGEAPGADTTPEDPDGLRTSLRVSVSVPFTKPRIYSHNVPPLSRSWRIVVTAPTAGTDFRAEFAVQIAAR